MVTDLRYLRTKWSQVLPVTETTVSEVRATVARTLLGWGLGGPELDDAKMIASELITNAIVHAEMSEVWYRIERDRLRVLFAVWDDSRNEPHLAYELAAESGRGLLIIDELSAEWGVERHGSGKWVYAVLDWENSEFWNSPGAPHA